MAHGHTVTGDPDYGTVRIDNTAAWGSADNNTILVEPETYLVDGTTYTTTTNENYPILGVNVYSQVPNSYLCKTGTTTGTTCGPIDGVESNGNYADVRLVTCIGDSGRPVYIAGRGYGLLIGGVYNSSGCSYPTDGVGYHMYYQGLNFALNQSNVSLN